jgi:exonuclease III
MNLLPQLSLLSWNVRGMGNARKCYLVKDAIRKAQIDLICLQETK